MPNHVINELIFRDISDGDDARIRAAILGAEGKIDFETLVPVPVNMWWYSVGSAEQAAFKRTALDWNTENWGTKWNAYSQEPVERVNDVLVARFQTAWRPPYSWLAAVFNSLKLPFDHNWLDEGQGRGFCGHFKLDSEWGAKWSEQPAPEYMQRHLHKLLWGVETFDEEPAS